VAAMAAGDGITYLSEAEAAQRAQRIATRQRLARRPRPARTSADAIAPPPPAPPADQGAPAAQPPTQPPPRPDPAPTSSTRSTWSPAGPVDDGAGVLLGLLAWVVTLAYLDRGLPGVRDLLRAKFINQGPDREWLP
jgi:hypothetical protein